MLVHNKMWVSTSQPRDRKRARARSWYSNVFAPTNFDFFQIRTTLTLMSQLKSCCCVVFHLVLYPKNIYTCRRRFVYAVVRDLFCVFRQKLQIQYIRIMLHYFTVGTLSTISIEVSYFQFCYGRVCVFADYARYYTEKVIHQINCAANSKLSLYLLRSKIT